MPTAVFRADAAPTIGAGHVRRCLTLAHTLTARGWRIGFAGIAESRRMLPALAVSGYDWLTLDGSPEAELAAMREAFAPPDLLVVDHYGRGEVFERAGRGWARWVAALDDLAERDHDVDLLLDQTAGRVPNDYRSRVPAGATVLTGTDYVLLRPEIRAQRSRAAPMPAQARRILVTFGGADAEDLSARAVDALSQSRFASLAADVVVGRGYPNPQRLASHAAPNTCVSVDPPELPRLMAEADIAIAGSGTTAWELAYLGVPALLITNSKGTVVAGMVAAGAAQALGEAGAVSAAQIADGLTALAGDPAARAAMSDAGQRLVDGRGAARVADAIERILG